jgi:ribose 5-phosphate isomerase A
VIRDPKGARPPGDPAELLADPARAAAATAAARLVEAGMTIGLGSGRAVFATLELLARRWGGAPPVRVVAASSATERLARERRFEPATLDGDVALDLALDGADEVDQQLGLVKGGGGALLREKLVLAAARRVAIVAESGKQVAHLGQTHPLPVEVVRFAWRDTRRRVLALLPAATLRRDAAGAPVVTDEGHHLLDCRLPPTDAAALAALAAALKATLGVVEHGLFLDLADEVLLGAPDGSLRVLRRR